MKINVLLFGGLVDVAGKPSILVDKDQFSDVQSLHTFLLSEFPGLQYKKFTYAVNQTIVHFEQPLQAGDEVALLPPFSGG
jgi:molybdopterin synthase sulfur carrier subunit